MQKQRLLEFLVTSLEREEEGCEKKPRNENKDAKTQTNEEAPRAKPEPAEAVSGASDLFGAYVSVDLSQCLWMWPFLTAQWITGLGVLLPESWGAHPSLPRSVELPLQQKLFNAAIHNRGTGGGRGSPPSQSCPMHNRLLSPASAQNQVSADLPLLKRYPPTFQPVCCLNGETEIHSEEGS